MGETDDRAGAVEVAVVKLRGRAELFLSEIYGERPGSSELELLSTGFHISYNGQVFLVTAAHTYAQAAHYDSIGHTEGPFQDRPTVWKVPTRDLRTTPYEGDGLKREAEHLYDVAVSPCPSCSPGHALDLEASFGDVTAGSPICVAGFPASGVLKIPSLPSLPMEVSLSTFLGVAKDDLSRENGFAAKIHLAISYPMDSSAVGFSGAPAWFLDLDSEDMKFAGIVQRWLEDEKRVIVTRSKVLMALMYGWFPLTS